MLIGELTRGTRLTGVLSSGGRSGPDSYVPLSVEEITVDDVVISDMIGELLQAPPISFQSAGSALLDYVIYGADGGVGDLNLFDKDNVQMTTAFPQPQTGVLTSNASYGNKPRSVIIRVDPNTTYTIQIGRLSNVFLRAATYSSYPEVGDTGTVLSTAATITASYALGATFTTPADAAYLVWYFSWDASADLLQEKLSTMMVGKWSGCRAYHAYGTYGIPVAISGDTSYDITISLNVPLSAGDSVSFEDTGVVIPANVGSNTLSVGTTVQPELVYIKYNDLRG